ncbi:60S ribosomal protein L34A [Arthromyces matolae]|nr:60S ribosomal protein L34A [Arthromyces matolae]
MAGIVEVVVVDWTSGNGAEGYAGGVFDLFADGFLSPMAQRVTLRKRTPYNTTSNRRRVVKTPGGKLVYHHLKKPASAPKCGDCGIGLPGIPALRPRQYATISKTQKTVRRAYGGSRCGDCVKSRILRAFLVEEAKIVKKVIKSQNAAAAARK